MAADGFLGAIVLEHSFEGENENAVDFIVRMLWRRESFAAALGGAAATLANIGPTRECSVMHFINKSDF